MKISFPKISLFDSCCGKMGLTQSSTPADPAVPSAQLDRSSVENSSSNGVQTDAGVDLRPNEEELKEKVIESLEESLEEERSLAVQAQVHLHEEQERVRKLSKQLDIEIRKVRQAQHSYQQVQERLVHEKEQKRKVDEKLRMANVLRLSDRQERKELETDRNRYRNIVHDLTSKRLLAGGTNIQAAFPTLLEVLADIRRTLTVSVSEWIEEVSPMLDPNIALHDLLAQLFRVCQDVVKSQHGRFKSFFVGGAGAACKGSEPGMDESTASFMLRHMRHHYCTLFPVTGTPFKKACRGVISRLADGVKDRIRHLQVAPGLEKVIQEYLLILVGGLLQHPPVEFANDCGMENDFDPKLHADSIDGDDVGAGEKCIVVFPALMKEIEGEGLQPLNKKYILPLSLDDE